MATEDAGWFWTSQTFDIVERPFRSGPDRHRKTCRGRDRVAVQVNGDNYTKCTRPPDSQHCVMSKNSPLHCQACDFRNERTVFPDAGNEQVARGGEGVIA